MWMDDVGTFKFSPGSARNNVSHSGLKIELPAPFNGDGKQSFLSWTRQLEVAVKALIQDTADYDYELVRILPTRLGQAAFLLWDSFPAAVKSDYAAVKERLNEAFGQKQFMDRFKANLNARLRAPNESLEVYAADISRLVQEAFPEYGDVACRQEKFRRFLAGLDPSLRAKCYEQGATDLEEALIIAGRCENARESFKMDYMGACNESHFVKEPMAVRSVSEDYGLRRAVDKLSEDLFSLRIEMKEMREENKRLQAAAWGPDNRHGSRSPYRSGYHYSRDERGDQPWRDRDQWRGRSPDRRTQRRNSDDTCTQRQDLVPADDVETARRRSPSPSWRSRKEVEMTHRSVRFLSPQRNRGVQQGNGQ